MPAARRAWMAAISSSVKPAEASEVDHDGGMPTYLEGQGQRGCSG